MIRDIREIMDLRGKCVLVRTSLDVPIKDGVVQNTFRVLKSLPTIQYLLESGARVLILTHIGRDPKNTTLPLRAVLESHISLTYIEGVVGPDVENAVAALTDGTALLLGNVRAHTEEESNDPDYARALSSLADIFVNDAFAVSHRAHASIVGVPKHLPSYAGITFMEEYTELMKAFSPEHPSLFILGGAKFETKAPLIERFADVYTNAFIGGANANDFLKGKGFPVGESLLSPVDLSTSPLIHKENILIPVDVVAVQGEVKREVLCDEVLPQEKILDIGSKSVELLAPYIKEAKTILWNGPLGYYEGGYDTATKACAKLIAESDAHSIIGGGDTVAAIESLGLQDSFSFLSTSGGAMLEFLEKKTLPGIEVLNAQSTF